MYTKSQRGADCCVVAIANYFGREYNEVWLALMVRRSNALREDADKHGFLMNTWLSTARFFAGKELTFSCPRRGQDKITGIARMARPNRKAGHLVVIIDGHVFDSWSEGIPIAEYRARTGYNLKELWS